VEAELKKNKKTVFIWTNSVYIWLVASCAGLKQYISNISMAISANLGRDTNHNSAKLVCDHPLRLPRAVLSNVFLVFLVLNLHS